jgi:hypothetical protein
MNSPRLCSLCGELITLDATFQIVCKPKGKAKTLVVDLKTGAAHVLLSPKTTARRLSRQQKSNVVFVVKPAEPSVATAPIPCL